MTGKQINSNISQNPWLSIIVPIYNVEKYLNKCLETIDKQTFSNYEVIMVDDGSTDNSSEICTNYSTKNSRFKYFRKENGGLFHARLSGVEKAVGEYFTFCDADDYYANKRALQTMFDAVNSGHSDAVQFGFKKKYNHLAKQYSTVKNNLNVNRQEFLTREYPKLLCSHWAASHLTMSVWNKIYHRSLLDNLPDFEGVPRIFWGEDLIINLHLLQKCESICYIPDALYCYRQSSGGTNKFSLNTMRDLDNIKTYQMQFLKEYPGEEKDKIENVMFSEIAGWFYYYIRDARRYIDDDQVRQLIAESLELPSFRSAREYYLNRNDSSEFVKLLRNADIEEYMIKTKVSDKKPTVKESIINALKKAYKTI